MLSLKGNGMYRLMRDMAKDIRHGLMVVSMRGIGRMIRLMEEEDLYMLM